jgi:hypothetical protein
VTPTTRDTAELLALKKRIEALSPADRFRLVAHLVEAGKYEIAETLASNLVDELRALRLLRHQGKSTR